MDKQDRAVAADAQEAVRDVDVVVKEEEEEPHKSSQSTATHMGSVCILVRNATHLAKVINLKQQLQTRWEVAPGIVDDGVGVIRV